MRRKLPKRGICSAEPLRLLELLLLVLVDLELCFSIIPTKIWGLGPCNGESNGKKMENEMETGII